jgi:hypothetical protein
MDVFIHLNVKKDFDTTLGLSHIDGGVTIYDLREMIEQKIMDECKDKGYKRENVEMLSIKLD